VKKRKSEPKTFRIKLLDGRSKKAQHVEDIYKVKQAEPNSEYGFILVSLSSKAQSTIPLTDNVKSTNTIILFRIIELLKPFCTNPLEITE